MNINELDYELPRRLIAQQALADRARSRLMVVDRGRSDVTVEHHHFENIGQWLRSGDCLVLNNTKVIPARFFAQRATGRRIEGLFLNRTEQGQWQVLLKNASRLKTGETIAMVSAVAQSTIPAPVDLQVIERIGQGHWLVQPTCSSGYLDILNQYGCTPLPPYIRRDNTDNELSERQRYQTVYAEPPGSVAAPTAGLHFTKHLLQSLMEKGIQQAYVTLHVGLGTFKAISTEKLEDHPMHAEQYQLDQTNTDIINRTIDAGGRIVAVGTTSIRTLETLADKNNHVQPGDGWTKLFIQPGYQFKIVNAIITNFHLPKTTLLALVCAFAGTERVMAAYRQAVENEYRFFSYGDAMLLF